MTEIKNTYNEMLNIEELEKVSGGRQLYSSESDDLYKTLEWKNERVKQLKAEGKEELSKQLDTCIQGYVQKWYFSVKDSDDCEPQFFSEFLKTNHPEYF